MTTFSQFDTPEFDSCIACGRGRGGADAYYCEVCLDNGAPEMVLNDSPFFTTDEMREIEAEIALGVRRVAQWSPA